MISFIFNELIFSGTRFSVNHRNRPDVSPGVTGRKQMNHYSDERGLSMILYNVFPVEYEARSRMIQYLNEDVVC